MNPFRKTWRRESKRLTNAAHQTLRAFGFDYLRFNPTGSALARRQKLLQTYHIDLVLDVGANRGQYGSELRRLGYRGKIISFEPLATAYVDLARTARADKAWQTFPFALGAQATETIINVADNSYSSSLLEMLPAHLALDSQSKYVAQQTTQVQTLDAIFESLCRDAHNIYLKMDTQGFELQVLAGAANSLTRIQTIQLEMSLVPLYKDAPLFQECFEYLTARNYQLVSLEPGMALPATGQLTQIDGIFHRDTA